MRILVLLVTVLGCCSTALAHKVPVHDAMTERAFRKSERLQQFVVDFGLERELPFPDSLYAEYTSSTGVFGVYKENGRRRYSFTPEGLLRLGSVMEDTGTRPLNHFYQPETPTSGKPLTESGLLGSSDAQSWAFDASDNPRSWVVANNLAYRALTATQISDRDAAAAELFYTLGHAVHLVQDMSQPSHVRDDAHMGHMYGGPSLLEEWGKENLVTVRQLLNQAGGPKWRSESRAYLRDLARYSTENFFSDDTVPQDPLCAAPPGWCTYPPTWLLEDRLANGPGPGFDALHAWLVNDHPPEGTATRVARLTPDWTYYLVDPQIGDINPHDPAQREQFFEFHDAEVVAQNAAELMPRAVEYSAGLLDFFFRARVELTIEAIEPFNSTSDLLTYRIRNISTVVAGDADSVTLKQFYEAADCSTGAVGFQLFASDLNDELTPCGFVSVGQLPETSVLGPGDSVTLKAVYPKVTAGSKWRLDRRTVLAYDGLVGAERGVVGAIGRDSRDFKVRLSGGPIYNLSVDQVADFRPNPTEPPPIVPPGFYDVEHTYQSPDGKTIARSNPYSVAIEPFTAGSQTLRLAAGQGPPYSDGTLTGTREEFRWNVCGSLEPMGFGSTSILGSHCVELNASETRFTARYALSLNTECRVFEGLPEFAYEIECFGGNSGEFMTVFVQLRSGESLQISSNTQNSPGSVAAKTRLFLYADPFGSRQLLTSTDFADGAAGLSVGYAGLPGSGGGQPLWVEARSQSSATENCDLKVRPPFQVLFGSTAFEANVTVTVQVVAP